MQAKQTKGKKEKKREKKGRMKGRKAFSSSCGLVWPSSKVLGW